MSLRSPTRQVSRQHWSALTLACFLAAGLGFGVSMLRRASQAPVLPVHKPAGEVPVSLAGAPDLLRHGLEDPETAFDTGQFSRHPTVPEATPVIRSESTGSPVALAHSEWGIVPRGRAPAVDNLVRNRQAGVVGVHGAHLDEPERKASFSEHAARSFSRVYDGVRDRRSSSNPD